MHPFCYGALLILGKCDGKKDIVNMMHIVLFICRESRLEKRDLSDASCCNFEEC